MRIINYIPCKTTSVRIPRKNLKFYGNKRLIDYSIEYSKKTARPTLVSTDDANLIDSFDVEFVHLRTGKLASRELTNFQVMNEIFSSSIYDNYDYVCLLQPSHPIRADDLYSRLVEKINGVQMGDVIITSFLDNFQLNNESTGVCYIEGSIYMLPIKLFREQRDPRAKFWHFPINSDDVFNIDEPADELKFLEYLSSNTSKQKSFIDVKTHI